MTSTASSLTLVRRPLELRFRRVALHSREWLTPTNVRLRLTGADLRGFDSPGADDHIRVFFPETDSPLSLDQLRAEPSREYTPLSWGEDWLDLEFVIHDDGPASAWARGATIGAQAAVGGPRMALVPSGSLDSVFLAGDETALPAIRRFLDALRAGGSGRVLLETAHSAEELRLEVPRGVQFDLVAPDPAAPSRALADALDQLGAADRPAGDLLVFIAAEQSIVRPGRRLAVQRWGLDPELCIVKGYWKRGTAEYHAPH